MGFNATFAATLLLAIFVFCNAVSAAEMAVKLKACINQGGDAGSGCIANCTTYYIKQDDCQNLGKFGSIKFRCDASKTEKYIWNAMFDSPTECSSHKLTTDSVNFLNCDFGCQFGGPGNSFLQWKCNDDSVTIENCQEMHFGNNTCGQCSVFKQEKLGSCFHMPYPFAPKGHTGKHSRMLIGDSYVHAVRLQYLTHSTNNCTASTPGFGPDWFNLPLGQCNSVFGSNTSKSYNFEASCTPEGEPRVDGRNVFGRPEAPLSLLDLPSDMVNQLHLALTDRKVKK